MLEIEAKFRVEDPGGIRALLAAKGLRPEGAHPTCQVDHYFQGIGRDFRQTGEALRLRVEDGRFCFTYKGKPTLGKQGAKIRREIEFDLSGSNPGEARDFLVELGFQPVGIVSKKRWQYIWNDPEGNGLVALDEVEKLGTFLEVEFLVAESDRDLANQKIEEVSRSLGLSHPEPRSYLRMVMESAGL